MPVPVNPNCLQSMPINFGCSGGCPPGSSGSAAIIAFGGAGNPCTVCFDDTGAVTSICVPSPTFPGDGSPVEIVFANSDGTLTQWGGTVAGPDYNSFCLASITSIPAPMTSLPYQGD